MAESGKEDLLSNTEGQVRLMQRNKYSQNFSDLEPDTKCDSLSDQGSQGRQ